MGILFPVAIVAAILAGFYGRTIHHMWLPAIITFACVLVGGICFSGIGEIGGIVLSALIIFIAFTLPEQRRAASEEASRAKDASQLPNEEDHLNPLCPDRSAAIPPGVAALRLFAGKLRFISGLPRRLIPPASPP